jgi:hypothetical protein
MNHFGLTQRAGFDQETNARLNLMESMLTSSTGVKVQHIFECFDPFYAQDMAVPANKDMGWISIQVCFDLRCPPARSPSDMRHPDRKLLNLKPLMLGYVSPE